jgi:hypothetical protein
MPSLVTPLQLLCVRPYGSRDRRTVLNSEVNSSGVADKAPEDFMAAHDIAVD